VISGLPPKRHPKDAIPADSVAANRSRRCLVRSAQNLHSGAGFNHGMISAQIHQLCASQTSQARSATLWAWRRAAWASDQALTGPAMLTGEVNRAGHCGRQRNEAA
jgi:hypothetical protein